MSSSDWSSDVCSSDRSLSRDEGRGPTGFDEREYESVMVQEKMLRASLRGAQRRSNPASAGSPRPLAGARGDGRKRDEIGSASWRERVCQAVSISGGDVPLKKQTEEKHAYNDKK